MIERDLRVRIGTDSALVAERALAEDGPEDVTTRVAVDPSQFATAIIEFRSNGVLAGTAYADAVTTLCDLGGVIWQSATGSRITASSITMIPARGAPFVEEENNPAAKSISMMAYPRESAVNPTANTKAGLLVRKRNFPMIVHQYR